MLKVGKWISLLERRKQKLVFEMSLYQAYYGKFSVPYIKVFKKKFDMKNKIQILIKTNIFVGEIYNK